MNQVLQLREELEAKTKSETAAQVELGKLRSLVDVAGQPYGYFIGMVQDKDQEIVQLKTAQAALQASHDELLAENDGMGPTPYAPSRQQRLGSSSPMWRVVSLHIRLKCKPQDRHGLG